MSMITIEEFFTDPILRAPILGAILMCFASSLIGVLAFVKRRSLIGEALAHATYPGVAFGALFAALFFPSLAFSSIFIGAFLFSWVGLLVIQLLEKRPEIHPDAALCTVLSLFLGIGITVTSRMQITHPLWQQKVQMFLFGQAVTIGDEHLGIYLLLSLMILGFLLFRFRQIELTYFDEKFAESLGVYKRQVQFFTSFFLVLALVIGIRSVGVVLISGMLVAPAAFARQYTKRLSSMFVIAGIVGSFSGFFGVYLSVQLPLLIDHQHPPSLPTGPMILLVAVFLTSFALLFSSQTGWISRRMRIRRFQMQQQVDHLLKALWKRGPCLFRELKQDSDRPIWSRLILLFFLNRGGWITTQKGKVFLTSDGKRRGARLVRLHRLWELYLTSQLFIEKHRVHCSAEEMEHILTPEIEERLTKLLKDPKVDPHKQPIPAREEI
jgi:manganese/zinc/iron transport system permease protein